MTGPRRAVPPGLREAAARLAGLRGRDYWRSLDALAARPDVDRYVRQEFPDGLDTWTDPVGRRRFLSLMAGSLALAGFGACTQPPAETIVPYVRHPEELVPGQPLFYATAAPHPGDAAGVLVESHLGRPTRIEGNRAHPMSGGGTDAATQAAILELYDPDRSQVVSNAGQISTWDAFLDELTIALGRVRGRAGAGLRLLTGTVTSPSLAAEIQALLRTLPEAVWHQYEPVGRDAARAGARLAFGEVVDPVYRLDRARVVVALDDDILYAGPGHVRHARDFATGRRMTGNDREMNRLYVAEPSPSVTGAMADHRLPVAGHDIEAVAHGLARRLGVPGAGEDPVGVPGVWLDAAADDLLTQRGRGLVCAGWTQPPVVHALAHAMNERLGNAGRTVRYIAPIDAGPAAEGRGLDSLAALADAMYDGLVETLVVLSANPVYTAPGDMGFIDRFDGVPLRIHLGLYADETAQRCHWHLPEAHWLESWGDARAADGTATIVQPLIQPLYGGRTAHEVVSALRGRPTRTAYEIVRAHWDRELGDDDTRWARALHDGVVAGSAAPARPVQTRAGLSTALAARASGRGGRPPAADPGELELVVRPDPCVADGRAANNGWLQELPKPITMLTWDNAVLVSPALATRLGIANEDVVELRVGDGPAVQGPVWVQPGQAAGSVTVHLGYGRQHAGRIGTGAGFDAYRLQSVEALWMAAGLTITPVGRRWPLATTQDHHQMEGRDLVRAATRARYLERPSIRPGSADPPGHADPVSLHPPRPGGRYGWGMSIDLNACTGCNACVIGCQAENNIPIVGKAEVGRGRAMHWIRVDRYYEGEPAHPAVVHQPVPCMHCEQAPCEVVCPVGATVHSPEGLNEMIYNRCVGTRYCSNNCPYKVRRFNFLEYTDAETPVLALGRNPDVTVRTRGVMEKCTYCVQRINGARIAAVREGRPIRDGEIVTACQAACPTQAIVFGDVEDPSSRVSRLKAEPRHYTLLPELNTRPRTGYLAKLRNPHPWLADDAGADAPPDGDDGGAG